MTIILTRTVNYGWCAMTISQKCQYAVRAILDLAQRWERGPVRSGEVAARQAVPPRFLENILNELKASGLVESRRGAQGGFMLACDPRELTVGRVIRLIDGPLDPVRCTKDSSHSECPLHGRCSFLAVWEEAKAAVEAVYDRMTFAELARRQNAMDAGQSLEYSI